MSRLRWNPKMTRRRDLRDEIDELFADLWQVSRLGGLRRGFRPQLDCFRTHDPESFTVVVDIAGVDPDRVNVTTAEHALVISGERRREDCGGRSYQQMEIDYGPFQRVVQLPDDADPAGAEARYDRGLLRIVIPIEQAAPRESPVPIEVRREA
jgi:HSP20 family protein